MQESVRTIESSERPTRFKSGEFFWRDFPTLGYVIAGRTSGLTFYHPGDLHEAFDSQRDLRGRVDYMFFPLGKLDGIELTIVENVRPRFVIPIHYWLDAPDFPIPLHINRQAFTAVDLFSSAPLPGARTETYWREIRTLIRAHWGPSPARPLETIEQLARKIKGLAEVVVLEAGHRHHLDA